MTNRRLYDRAWSLTAGNRRIASVDGVRELTVVFEVAKSLEREPNTASIRIANMAPSTRRALEELEDPQVELRAGYPDLEDVIFVGDARDIWSERDATEVWTTIEAEDGGTSYRTAEIERSYGPDTPVETVIRACAEAMGVGLGNTTSAADGATLDQSGDNFAEGTVLSGAAWRQLDRVCRSCSLRWSVQNGVLQLRGAGRPAMTSAILLRPGSGLVGSPTRGKKEPREQYASFSVRSLLIPGIYPGRVIRVESSEVTADLLCRRTRYVGDSRGEDWFVDIEAQEYDS
jgi:hypothetical protein